MAGPARHFAVYTCTMTSGATLTNQIDLGGAYTNAFLEIPAITNSVHFIKAANSDSGTFRRVYNPPLNSATVGANAFAIVSTATNCIVPIPQGLRYLKIESEIAIADGATYRVIVGD
jgi:hypothetical protein